MQLTGKEDLRVIKTIEGIKSAFEALICEKDYDKITVKELCERARINKKTFYHYYETLDFLLAEMQAELSHGFIERIKDYSLPDDLNKVNREFFVYASLQGLAYEKITCGGTYRTIRDEMTVKVNDESWSKSKKYQKLSDYEKKVLLGFINNAVLGAYREWVLTDKKIPMDEIIEITNRIVLGGVKGFFR
ncbi:MAG: TetR/AcrR family transcriptional regulator [Clostridiales bacterium]|nr:TetR/AcrR family transcriptional regulator [Clostridiales bacterium]